MPNTLAPIFLLTAFLVGAPPAAGQEAAAPHQALAPRLGPSILATGPLPPFHPGHDNRATFTPKFSLTERLSIEADPNHKGRYVLIGGLIGAATGIAACTVISNLAKDPGTGFSTCDAKAYLGFGVGGFAVGALIGLLIK